MADIEIKGLDNGFLDTKDNNRRIFRSAYTLVDDTPTDKYKITINGVDYYFGRGTTTAEVNKNNSTVNMVCTLGDLAMSGDKDYFLVVGLPIAQVKTMKDELREVILGYNDYEVIYRGKQFQPRIRDVSVFAQGAGAVFNAGLDDNDYIILDIGSYTINVMAIELRKGIPYIFKSDSWFDGVLTLYNQIIKEVLIQEGVRLEVRKVERMLRDGYLMVDGKKCDTTYVKAIMDNYLENINSRFKQNYPSYRTDTILFCGGGSLALSKHFNFNNSIVLPDAQFANAIGYYRFGLQKYGNLLERRRMYV